MVTLYLEPSLRDRLVDPDYYPEWVYITKANITRIVWQTTLWSLTGLLWIRLFWKLRTDFDDPEELTPEIKKQLLQIPVI